MSDHGLSRALTADVDPRERRNPPCVDLEAEAEVLGAVLMDEAEAPPDAPPWQSLGVWTRVAAALEAEDFYGPRHREVFAAMVRLKADRHALTAAALRGDLSKRGVFNFVGGTPGLRRLMEENDSLRNVEEAVAVVADLAAKRRLGTIHAQGARRIAAGQPLAEAHADALRQIRALRLPGVVLPTMGGEIDAASRRMERRLNGQERVRVVPSSVADLNDALEGGWGAGLNFLAARPFLGKTLLLTQEVLFTAMTAGPALYLSYEKRRAQIVDEMVSCLSGVPLDHITHPERLNAREMDLLQRAWATLHDLPITIVDKATPGHPLTVPAIEGAMVALPAPPVMVGVDHGRKLRPAGRYADARQGFAELAEGLHELGLNHDVAIVALLHINRAGVKGKVPSMEDLKEAGEFEEAADIVGIMHSEARYPTQKYAKGQEPPRDVVEVFVPKRRLGRGGGYARLRLRGEVQRFCSTLAPDADGLGVPDVTLGGYDGRPSHVAVRAPGPVPASDGAAIYASAGGLPDVDATELELASRRHDDLGPQDAAEVA